MVEEVAIQKNAPGQGSSFLVSPEQNTHTEDNKNRLAHKTTQPKEASKKLTGGSIRFTDEVIETLSFIAATEVPGLAAEIGAGDITQDRMLKKNRLRGIRVKFPEGRVHIFLSITVKPGFRAICVAKEVQERVRRNVENMTGLTVKAVDVQVASIQAQETVNIH